MAEPASRIGRSIARPISIGVHRGKINNVKAQQLDISCAEFFVGELEQVKIVDGVTPKTETTSKNAVGYFVAGPLANPGEDRVISTAHLVVIDGDASFNADTGEDEPDAPSVEDVITAVNHLGWLGCVYTSWSHQREGYGNRWRLILVPDRPINRKEYPHVVDTVHAQLIDAGLSLAPAKESRRFGQAWYLPGCPREREASYRHHIINQPEGKLLNVDALVEVAERDATERNPSSAAVIHRDGEANSPISLFVSSRQLDWIHDQLTGAEYELKRQQPFPDVDPSWPDDDPRRKIWVYLPPQSTTGSPGCRLFWSADTNRWRVCSFHGSDPLSRTTPDGKPLAIDAFDVFTLLTHGGDVENAIEALREMDFDDELLRQLDAWLGTVEDWNAAAVREGLTRYLKLQSPTSRARAWKSLRSASAAPDATLKEELELLEKVGDRQAEVAAEQELLPQFLDRFCYMTAGEGRVVDLDTGHPMSAASFKRMMAAHVVFSPATGKPKHVSDIWMAHPDRVTVDQLGWRPTPERVYTSPEGLRMLNTYHDPAWPEPDPEQYDRDVKVLTRHLDYLITHDADARWLLCWMADIVQNPADRPSVTPLLVTPEFGTGRGWLAELMTALLGSQAGECKMSDLTGSWSDFLHQKIVVSVPEVHQHGQKQYSVGDELRQLMTSRVWQYNLKSRGNFSDSLYVRLFLQSNRPNALILPRGDRRVHVIECTEDKRAPFYFETIYGLLKQPGFLASIWHYLSTLDLGKFNPNLCPDTVAKQRMTDGGRSELDMTFDNLLAALAKHQVRCIGRPQINHLLGLAGVRDTDSATKVIEAKLREWLRPVEHQVRIPRDHLDAFRQQLGVSPQLLSISHDNRWRVWSTDNRLMKDNVAIRRELRRVTDELGTIENSILGGESAEEVENKNGGEPVN